MTWLSFNLPSGKSVEVSREELETIAKGKTRRECFRYLGLEDAGCSYKTFTSKISNKGIAAWFRDARKTRKRVAENYKLGIKKHSAECFHRDCTNSVTVEILEGEAPPKHLICWQCKRDGPPEERRYGWADSAAKDCTIDKRHRERMSSTVKRYSREEIKRIAGECTPPSEIKDSLKGAWY